MKKTVIIDNKNQDLIMCYKQEILENSSLNLVMCHGFDSSHLTYALIYKELSQHFSTYMLDLPGHGQSNAKVRHMKVAFLADAIRQFIHNLSLKNVVLIGHSLGGGTVSYLYNEQNIKAFVLLAPINPAIAKNEIILKNILLPKTIEGLKDSWKKLIYDMSNINPSLFSSQNLKASIQRIAKYRPFNEALTLDIKNNQFTITYNYLSINLPTKIIFGSHDKIIPTKDSIDWLSKLIKNHDISIIDQCGHSPHYEKPKETATLILEFLLKLT